MNNDNGMNVAALERISPVPEELDRVVNLKHGPLEQTGWGPQMRNRFGYYLPGEWYEGVVGNLVSPKTRWLDVGCGRFLFPNNPRLSSELSSRCTLLRGVDPDPTILENPYVHESVQISIDDYQGDRTFDLITLRMVAEHIQSPNNLMQRINEIAVPGCRVVIFTIFQWSPIPILTKLIPFSLHHAIKKVLWGTEEKDTFPVAYKMNTRRELNKVFESNGFRECFFSYLDDCSGFGRFRFLSFCELSLRQMLNAMGLHYPEVCLLGVYQKES